MKKYLFLFFILFLISGCDVGIGGSKKSSKNSSTNQTNNISEINSTTITAVRVFTIAPVREALVTDSDNNIADFNISSGEYIFKSKVKYPVKAFSTASTFIDIDYDGKKSANDILPLTLKKGLKSYSNEINLVTDFEARIVEENLTKTKAQDPNTTITINTLLPFYDSQLNTKFDTNISANPLTNINLAETLFGAYNYIVEDKGVFAKIDDIDKKLLQNAEEFKDPTYKSWLGAGLGAIGGSAMFASLDRRLQEKEKEEELKRLEMQKMMEREQEMMMAPPPPPPPFPLGPILPPQQPQLPQQPQQLTSDMIKNELAAARAR